jgi:amino acid adenylation domain-containing protein
MADGISVIQKLARAGIEVSLRGGKLVTRAAPGVITPGLASLITSYKQDLIEFLSARSAAGMFQLPPVGPASESARHQLSYAQQRFWLIDRMAGGSVSYHMSAAIMIDGVLHRHALILAAQAVVRRHEVLRTVFADSNGVPRSEVLPHPADCLEEIDLATPGGGPELSELQQHISRESQRPFNLAREPGVRLTLFRLSPARHALLVNMHHIVSDGWSVGIFVQELIRLYGAFASGKGDDLSPLPFQYADYAVWQRAWPVALIDRQLEYWQQRLADTPQLHSLPTDYPRPGTSQNRAGLVSRQMRGTAAGQLASLGQQQGGTLFMALQLAFAVLLARWSNENDIVMGTPIAGRVRPELEDLIGVFINTLVLRSRIDSDRTFRELLQETVRRTVEAYDNQLVPFDRLVDMLRPERTTDHSPLVQILFAMQNTGAPAVRLPGLELSTIEVLPAFAKMDLTLNVAERDGVLYSDWEYDRTLFAPRTIERMAEQYERLLEDCAARPDVKLAELEMLSPAERTLLVNELNDNRRPFPQSGIAAVFDEVVARCADRIALIDGTARITYAAVAARVNALAAALRERGVAADSEEPIGIYLDRGADMVIAMLAVLKAGGAYVPLDLQQPAQRLEFILADSAVRIIISSSRAAAKLPESGPSKLLIDTIRQTPQPQAGAHARAGGSCGSLAYIMYTSGSTGEPKGVMVEQRGILRLVLNTNYMNIGPDDVVAQASNCAFDASTFEIWAALLNGAALAFIDTDTLLAPQRLESALTQLGVTTLWMTTSLLIQTVRLRPAMFAGLKYLFFGGEAAEPQSIERVLQAGKPEHFINIYGPTENTSFTTAFEVLAASPAGYPIGVPVSNTACYVLGRGRELVPHGAKGELFVGGDGVARGYLNRAALSAERFSGNPFAPGRLYATGDLVRWQSDGNLQFLGRGDEQMKVRGFRIEPGEVEQALLRLAGVEAAACVVTDHETRGKSLVAYVALEAAALREESRGRGLREQLAMRLPAYMMPDMIVVLPELPLNSNNKLDRQRLPVAQPSQAAEPSAAAEASDQPEGEMELALAGMWREVLQQNVASATVSFFELGGNSLSLMALSARIQETLGAQITVTEFFDSPSVREQARLVSGRIGLSDGQAIILKQPLAEDYPLSFAQQRLWFESLRDGGTSYNVPLALEFEGELDEHALANALRDIVGAHDVLRTRYFQREGLGRQSVAPPSQWSLETVDLRRESDPQRACAIRLQQQTDATIDLTRDPVFSAVLYKISSSVHCLLLKMHHIVTDGWSVKILGEQISSQYAAYASGNVEQQIDRPFIQYTDFAVWQQQSAAADAAEADLQRCVERLSFVRHNPPLPVDSQRYRADSYPLGTQSFRLEVAAADRLRRTALENRASLFAVALALFALVLGRYSRQSKLVIGTDFAGRDLQQTEALIGFFVNQLAIVAELDGTLTFAEYLGRVRESMLFSLQHQRVPMERIVGALGLERGISQHPLFQAMLVLQNFRRPQILSLPNLRMRTVPLESKHSKIDLLLTLVESGDGIDGDWEFNADYFKESTIGHLHRELLDLIELLGESASLTLDEMNVRLDRMAGERLAQLRQSTMTRLGQRSGMKSAEASRTRTELQ